MVWEAPRVQKKSVPGISLSVLRERNSRRGVEPPRKARPFAQKCAVCHGVTLAGGLAPTLLKAQKEPNVDPWQLGRVLPIRSPYATTVWDYINRAMPLNGEGTLTADEVYALTAFLLYKNDVISEDEVLDAQSLPKVKMPNREGFAPLPDWKPGTPRLQGYPY